MVPWFVMLMLLGRRSNPALIIYISFSMEIPSLVQRQLQEPSIGSLALLPQVKKIRPYEGSWGASTNVTKWTQTEGHSTEKTIAAAIKAAIKKSDSSTAQGSVALNMLHLHHNYLFTRHCPLTESFSTCQSWELMSQFNLEKIPHDVNLVSKESFY